jgi:hypothetical protein
VTPRKPYTPGDRYKWVALTNTTAGVLLATIDASIMIIAMPLTPPPPTRSALRRTADLCGTFRAPTGTRNDRAMEPVGNTAR